MYWNIFGSSGVDYTLIKTESFRASVVDQVLGIAHYAKYVKGLFKLAETFQRLQLQAFFDDYNIDEYDDELTTIQALKDAFTEESFSETRHFYNYFVQNSERLVTDIEKFYYSQKQRISCLQYCSNFSFST